MSVRTMARVWELSQHRGNDLLMLLAIADFADDEGNAYPSVQTLAQKCRMKARNTTAILTAIRKSGELEVRPNEGPKGTNRYRIVLPSRPLQKRAGVQIHAGMQKRAAPPAETCRKPLQNPADEPSVNHQEPSTMVDSKAVSICPHQKIIDLYHQLIPTGRRVKVWNATRSKKLVARWKEDKKWQTLDWWQRLFAYIAESDFLTGQTNTPGRPPFEVDLEWIISPTNLVKIIEGKYHRQDSTA